ncbi:hypothetical protein RB195_012621 [Necator americanus]|uniref:Secreted protein n=1 Tax=Necator americanus TaxID=51031 RepID=A0ABR1DUH8_NECAM
MGIFLLLGLAVPYAFAVRCYDFINTNDNRNTMKTWSYIEQYDTNNEMTWLASRSCGTPNLCKGQAACSDSGRDERNHPGLRNPPTTYTDTVPEIRTTSDSWKQYNLMIALKCIAPSDVSRARRIR